MPIPQPQTSQVLDHTTDRNNWNCHGSGQLLDGDGAVHRPIPSLLCHTQQVSGGRRRSYTSDRLTIRTTINREAPISWAPLLSSAYRSLDLLTERSDL